MPFRLVLTAIWLFTWSASARADLALSIVPTDLNITVGGTTIVNVELESDVDVFIGGIDFNLVAGLGGGTQGTFASPTSIFFQAPANPLTPDWDLTIPGQAFYSRNVGLVAPTTPGGVFLAANSPTIFATLTLESGPTAGGPYLLSFDSLFAIDGANQSISITSTGANFTFSNVSAVPEPSSLVLIGMAGVGMGTFCRLRKKRSQ